MDITITMVQSEIIDAIKSYLDKHDILTAGKEIEINLTAGRGPSGHSAVIAIKGSLNALSTAGMTAPVPPTPTAPPLEPAVPVYMDEPMFTEEPTPPEPTPKTRKPRTPAAPVPTPAQVTQVDNTVDDLFSEAANNVVEESVAEVTEEEESLFGA